MLTVRRIGDDCVEVVGAAAVDAFAAEAAEAQGVLWIDLVGSDPSHTETLCRLGVNDWVAEDILQPSTHPKAESHEDHLFLVVHAIDLQLVDGQFGQLDTCELDIVVGPGWLVTHAAGELEVIAGTRQALERDPHLGATPGMLAHTLLDQLVDVYEPYIDDFVPRAIDEVEASLFTERQPDPAVRIEIYLRRRDVQRLVRVAGPQAHAVQRLTAMAGELAAAERLPDYQALFADIADRLAYVANQTRSLTDQLDTAFDHYEAVVAHNQNEITKVLTMVSAVLLPITVVAGIYGMNFVYMPELDERWAYPAVMVLNVVIVVVNLTLFRLKGWIGGRGRTARVARTLQVGAGRVVRAPAMGVRVAGRSAARLAPWRMLR
ncbi:MAG: magnesium transporter CorA family protein [Actinomycetota bacterium]|nr:magnesium transporter CorA family protein [Actinomycetota bacterium]